MIDRRDPGQVPRLMFSGCCKRLTTFNDIQFFEVFAAFMNAVITKAAVGIELTRQPEYSIRDGVLSSSTRIDSFLASVLAQDGL